MCWNDYCVVGCMLRRTGWIFQAGGVILWQDTLGYYDLAAHLARVQGLAPMRRPNATDERIHFLQTVQWMRTSLPQLSQVVWPLQDMMKECTRDPPRTRRDRPSAGSS